MNPLIGLIIALTFNGATTGPFDIAGTSAAAVQAALQALPTIGAGNVTVTGAVSGGAGGTFTVTFGGSLAATNVSQITITNNTVNGVNAFAFATTAVEGGPANRGVRRFPCNPLD